MPDSKPDLIRESCNAITAAIDAIHSIRNGGWKFALPAETPAETRARRESTVRNVPGSRHRLKVIDCGHCGRPCFKVNQRCPGLPKFRPPVAEWFRGVLMCGQCVKVLFDGPNPKSRVGRKRKEPAGESRARTLGRGV